jgi:hypothetical protein
MASTALLPTLTKRDATTMALVARATFPDKLQGVTLKGEVKAQHDLLMKLGGDLVAHQDPHLGWDTGWKYNQNAGYEQLELKVPQPLENKKAVSSFAELCGVTDANWVEMRRKDWGNGLGLEISVNHDDLASRFGRARRHDPGLTVLELARSQVQIQEEQGMRCLIADPSCDALAFISWEELTNLLDSEESIRNALRGVRLEDSPWLYLATRGDGPHKFYFSNFGLKDGEQITRSTSTPKDWEVLVTVSPDGSQIEKIWCLWDDREHDVEFTSIDEFASAPASNPRTVSR